MLFANPTIAIWAFFLTVIPLIIIYLLRPKALTVVIPSVMFFTQITEQKKEYARTINRIIKDPLFLLQLLILIALIIAIATPFVEESKRISGGHTIIILDGSASMQAGDRFDDAIDLAKQYLTARNSIILAKNTPVIALRGEDEDSARNVLDNLPRTATTADLYQAIMYGSAMLPSGEGRIIVISDFANWDGEDPNVAKKLAEADGIEVSFMKVADGENKIAITGGWVSDDNRYTCIIKNYMASPVDATIDVTYNGETSTHDLAIAAHGSEYFALNDIGAGTTEIVVHPDDDMMIDNRAYVVIPFRQSQKVLYISDYDATRAPSAASLALIPSVDATFRTPGEVRSASVHVRNYDCAVVGLCNGSLRQSLCEDLADYAASGGGVVVMAQDALLSSDMGRLLPMTPTATGNETTLDYVLESGAIRDIDVAGIAVGKYLRGDAKRNSVTWVAAEDGTPVVSYWRIGMGKVVYLGLPDEMGDVAWNDFHTMPEYPIFWMNLIDYLCDAGAIADCNKQTGTILSFDSKTRLFAPGGQMIRTDELLLDEVGVYKLPDRSVAANLYDPKESNLADSMAGGIATSDPKTDERMIRTTVKNEYDWILLVAALVLIFAELYYIRSRGEL